MGVNREMEHFNFEVSKKLCVQFVCTSIKENVEWRARIKQDREELMKREDNVKSNMKLNEH